MEKRLSKLEVHELTAAYNSPVLAGVTVTLQTGSLVVLCGRNGCGKSTLLSVMAGVPDAALKVSGAVTLNDREIKNYKRRELARYVAYMEQTEYSTWNFKVSDYVLQGRYAHSKNGYYTQADHEICSAALQETGIASLAQRNVHELSGGEFQKVRIARALAQQPQFMLLDEPAANLDFVYEPQLMQQLKDITARKNIGIILSMHDVNLAARYADIIIFMPPAAPVISGTPQTVLNEENLNKTFGVEFIKGSAAEMYMPKL